MPVFYQYLADITGAVDFSSVETDYPRPVKIYERRLISDQRTYCCEITPSAFFEVLDYSVHFDEATLDRDDLEDIREFWLSQTDDWERGNGCIKYHSAFSYDGICTLPYFYNQGEEIDDEDGTAWDKALEFAQGNSLV